MQAATANSQQQQQLTQFGVSTTPRFMFGLKGDVRNNVHFLDDQRVLYPCGHNIVIYNLDDKSQIYIPGVEGSEGITTLALSASRRFLAVCERAEKALCLIYDLAGINQVPALQPRRKKILTS